MQRTSGIQRFALLWTLLLLLQQFNVVLLMNVAELSGHRTIRNEQPRGQQSSNGLSSMPDAFQYSRPSDGNEVQVVPDIETRLQKNANTESFKRNATEGAEEGLQSNSSHEQVNRQKRSEGKDIQRVINAIESSVEKMDNRHAFARNVSTWLKSCDSQRDQNIHFWRKHVALHPFFLVTLSIALYVRDCHEELRNRLQELLGIIDANDVIDFVTDFDISQVKDMMHSASERDFMHDADTPEAMINTETEEIVAENFKNINLLSELFDSFNGRTRRSHYGLQPVLDDIIAQHEAIQSIFNQDENDRPKRDAENREPKVSFSIDREVLKKVFDRRFVKCPGQLLANSITRHALKLINDRLNPQLSSPTKPLHRNRRAVDIDDETAKPFFIKSSAFPCKLLTSVTYGGQHVMSMESFSEEALLNQLWVWENGHLRNFGNELFARPDSQLLSRSAPRTLLRQFRDWLVVDGNPNSTCYVEVKMGAFGVEMRQNCQEPSQTWHFVPFEEARESFEKVACLFVIQSRDSCLVLEQRQGHLKSRLLTREVHVQQLWYWDQDRIRNANSHMYLASNNSEMFLTNKKDQAWSYKEVQVGDLITKVTFTGFSQTAAQSTDNKSSSEWHLIDPYDNEKMRCGRKNYFVLKNSEKPCNVLCVEQKDGGPHLSVPASVGILSFMVTTVFALSVAGVYQQRQSKQASAKFFFISAAVTGLVTVVGVTCAAVLRKVVKVVKFEFFDPEDPLDCLWYSQNGKLVNVRHGSELNANSSGAELTIDGGMLQKLGEGNCYLHAAGEQSISCQSEPSSSTWSLVDYDDNTFSGNVFCLYVLPQNQPRCEEVGRNQQTIGDHDVARDQQTAGDHGVFEQKLWYFHGNNLVNLDSGDVFSGNVSEQSPMNFGNYMQNCSTSLSLFFIQSKAANRRILGYGRSEGDVSFQYYDDDNVSDQLWYIKESHIVNYATGYKLIFNASSTNRTVSLGHRAEPDEKVWYTKDNRISATTENKTFYLVTETVNSAKRIVAKTLSEVSEVNAHWTFIPFDDQREYLHELMTYYFIQSRDEPCEVLTADNSTHVDVVFTAPVSETNFYTQLWFVYKGEIMNVGTGLLLGYGADISEQVKLVSNDQTTSGTKWTIHGSTVQPTVLNDKVLSINTYTGLVEIKYNRFLATQKWKMLEFSQAFDHQESLSCFKYDQKDYVFIKHESMPCKVLTASDDGLSLTFQEFEESIAARQLWYFKYDHLINVEFGKSVKVNNEAVSLRETRKYDFQQYVTRNGSSMVKTLNGKAICSILPAKSDDVSSLTCKTNFSTRKWSFVKLDDGLKDIGSIRCLFVIQSRRAPCEFVTGYVSDEKYGTLKVRPMIDDLVDSQIFYWRNHSLVHMKSGFEVSESPEALILKQPSHSHSKFAHDPFLQHITFANSDNAVAFDPNNDGFLVKEDIRYVSTQKWSVVELNDDVQAQAPTCPELPQPSGYFFIKHRDQPCLVLTGAGKGQSPAFKIFNQDNFYDQVWYVLNNQIVNVGKDLALMLGEVLPENSRQVIMWHSYAYSLRQRWSLTTAQSSSIQSQMDTSCFLSSDDFGRGATTNAVCSGKGSSSWNFVDVSDDYIPKVTCRFFIQSEEVSPCELLTGQGINRQVRLRPLNPDDVESQLWYWDGHRILNAKSKMAISDYGNTITLRHKDESLTQTWLHENTRIKSRANPNNVITFSHDTGGVYLFPLSRWSHKYQSWIFVSEKDGLENPDRLHCISAKSNPEMYIIRSEHKDCPLLKHVGNNHPGVRKRQKNVDEGILWVVQDDHIINVEAKTSLMATQTLTIEFETTYTHEPRQHWKMGNDRIKSWLYGPKFLEVTGSNVRLANRRETTKQQWKWFTLKEYEKDNKLMRCSRCYNQGEETASEVIGYIPILGWLYNLFRSVVYAAKDCPDVALTALLDFGLDITFDLLTFLSGGTAAALAYGIKSGLKFGLKAGLKATFKAVKGMVKMSIKSAKNGIRNLAKNGLKQTLKFKLKTTVSTMRTQLKTSIKGLKITLKSSVHSLKTHTINVGRLMLKSGKRMKAIATKTDGALPGLSKLSNFPRLFRNVRKTVVDKIQSIGKNLKSKLKRKLDDLSNKAEESINRSKHHKVRNTKLKCSRFRRALVPSGPCATNRVELHAASDDQTAAALSDARRYHGQGNVDIAAPEDILQDFEILSMQANLKKLGAEGQFSAIGIKQDGVLRDVDSIPISELRELRKSKKPPPEDSLPLRENPMQPGGRRQLNKDVRHTEQYLIENIKAKGQLDVCTERSPCTLYIFTKNSPCSNHAMGSNTLSCVKYIGRECQAFLHVKCVVGFDQIYTPLDYLHDKSWMEYFRRIIGTKQETADLFANHKWMKQQDIDVVEDITKKMYTSTIDADQLRRKVNEKITAESELSRMLKLREQNTEIYQL